MNLCVQCNNLNAIDKFLIQNAHFWIFQRNQSHFFKYMLASSKILQQLIQLIFTHTPKDNYNLVAQINQKEFGIQFINHIGQLTWKRSRIRRIISQAIFRLSSSDRVLTEFPLPIIIFPSPITMFFPPEMKFCLPVTVFSFPQSPFQSPSISFQFPTTSFLFPSKLFLSPLTSLLLPLKILSFPWPELQPPSRKVFPLPISLFVFSPWLNAAKMNMERIKSCFFIQKIIIILRTLKLFQEQFRIKQNRTSFLIWFWYNFKSPYQMSVHSCQQWSSINLLLFSIKL